jgi:hypothetical protein
VAFTPTGSSQEQLDIVFIEILDLNDCTPHFFDLSQPHHLSVLENVALPTPLLTLQPTDLDKGINGTTVFNITSGNEGQFFRIALAEGDTAESTSNRILFLVNPLNFDVLNTTIFNLTITIRDLGEDPLSLEQQVNIQVTNLEDEPPTFDTTSYFFNITENHPFGATEGAFAQVRAAVDRLEGQVFYDICRSCISSTHDASDYFGVNQASGVLFVKRLIDFEELKPPLFMFEIEASNQNTRQVQTTVVRVDVIDVNEHSPYYVCSEQAEIDLEASYSCESRENVNNSHIYIQEGGYNLTDVFFFDVKDDDTTKNFRSINRSVSSYWIVPEDNPFTVRVSGFSTFDLARMRLEGELDRELTPNYTVTLSVENVAQPVLSSETTVTVVLLDINDNAPEFTQVEYAGTVFEGIPDGMEILRVRADDPDEGENGTVTYSISGVSEEAARDWFQISSVDGMISVRDGSSLDYLRLGDGNRVSLSITASDSGSEAMSSSATVVISVLPSTTFISGSYQEYSSARFNVFADSSASFYLEFRSSERDGLLAYQMAPNGTIFSVQLQGGSVVANLGGSRMHNDSDISSDVWHYVHVQWTSNLVSSQRRNRHPPFSTNPLQSGHLLLLKSVVSRLQSKYPYLQVY